MAAVGSYESISALQGDRADVVVVTEENHAAVPQTLSKFSRSGYAALFLEEPLYAEFRETVDEINEYSDISIIPVPNQTGSMNVGLQSIRRNVERAVGMTYSVINDDYDGGDLI